jgi:hypothetical protein
MLDMVRREERRQRWKCVILTCGQIDPRRTHARRGRRATDLRSFDPSIGLKACDLAPTAPRAGPRAAVETSSARARSLRASSSGKLKRCHATLPQKLQTRAGVRSDHLPGTILWERATRGGGICSHQPDAGSRRIPHMFFVGTPVVHITLCQRYPAPVREGAAGGWATWQWMEALVSSQTSHCGCTEGEARSRAQSSCKKQAARRQDRLLAHWDLACSQAFTHRRRACHLPCERPGLPL